MSSLQRGFCLVAILSAFALSACGLVQLGSTGDQDADDDVAVDVNRSIEALAGGVSEHRHTEYARAEVWGTGEVDGACRTYEVRTIVYDRETHEPGGKVGRQWVNVRVREFCCDREEIFSVWNRSVNLDDADFEMNIHPNRHHLWDASVSKTVTVRNTADRSQEITLDISIDWTGLDDFRHRSEGRFLDGDHVSHYELWYEMATASGDIDLPGVTFDFDTQMRVWIGDENRTLRDAP
jgi:hypothetical protein